MMTPNNLPTKATKDREREQLQKDIDTFLANGGKIDYIEPMAIARPNTATAKKSKSK